MYSDFLRARRKLKRKCHYTRPRPNRWHNLHRRLEKTLVVLLSKARCDQSQDHSHGRVHDQSNSSHSSCQSRYYYNDSTDLCHDVSDATLRHVNSVLRPRRPCLNGIFGSFPDRRDHDMVKDGTDHDDPMDASMFLALVRILLKREIEKIQPMEKTTGVKGDDDAIPKDSSTSDIKEIQPVDIFEEMESDPSPDTAYLRDKDVQPYPGGIDSDLEPPSTMPNMNNMWGDTFDVDGEEIDKHPDLFEELRIDSALQNYFSANDMNGYNKQDLDIIPSHFENSHPTPDSHDATTTNIYPQTSKRRPDVVSPAFWSNPSPFWPGSKESAFSDSDPEPQGSGFCDEGLIGPERLESIDWNELRGDQSTVSEVGDNQQTSSDNGHQVSNRITFKSKPTDSSHPTTTPVFVCCAASMNTDALQFGEELSGIGIATNFNVNAIHNNTTNKAETSPWKISKGESVTASVSDTQRHKDEATADNPEPMTSQGDLDFYTQSMVMAFKNAGRFLADTFSPDTIKWSWLPIGPGATNPGSQQTMTTAMCALIIMCLALLMATGNVISLVGVVLDVIVHAALLSLVVIIAFTVYEVNDESSNPFIQGCKALLETIGCVRPSPDHAHKSQNIANECKEATLTSNSLGGGDDGCYGIHGRCVDHNRCSKTNTAGLGTEETPDDSGLDLSLTSTTQREEASSVMTPSSGSRRKPRKCKNETIDASTMTYGIAAALADDWPTRGPNVPGSSVKKPLESESISVQTDPICEDGEAMINYLPIGQDGHVTPATGLSRDTGTMKHVEAQANIDPQKIQEHAQMLQQRHQRSMRKLQRKFLTIRRRMRREAHDLKTCDQQRGAFLAKLQLALPTLQMEKNRLTAERFMFERQYMYQRKKNQDLVGRITKLNQQFQVLGQTHQPPAVSAPWRSTHLNRNMTVANLFGGGHSDMQQQQQQHPGQALPPLQQQQRQDQPSKPSPSANTPSLKSNTQMTLTQSLTPPSVPNKWLSNLQQQQQQQQQQQMMSPQQPPPPPPPPPQLQQIKHQHHQQQQVQQARLSIFQLLRNSASLASHQEEVSGLQQTMNEDAGKCI